MTNWEIVLALVVTFCCGSSFGRALERKRRTPPKLEYRWQCLKTGCHFGVEANDLDVLMTFAEGHGREFHEIEHDMHE